MSACDLESVAVQQNRLPKQKSPGRKAGAWVSGKFGSGLDRSVLVHGDHAADDAVEEPDGDQHPCGVEDQEAQQEEREGHIQRTMAVDLGKLSDLRGG